MAEIPDAPFEEQLDAFLNAVKTMSAKKTKPKHSIYDRRPTTESNGADLDDDFYADVQHSLRQQIF